MPPETVHLWGWWMQLQATRTQGMSANHISYAEIDSWSRLLNIQPTPFEVRCLIALDTVYLSCQADAKDGKQPNESS